MKKKHKAIIALVIIVLLLVFGYSMRLDRFGFTSIHWADFIYYKDVMYTAVTDSNGKYAKVDSIDIGDQLGEVKYTLQGNVRNTHYCTEILMLLFYRREHRFTE